MPENPGTVLVPTGRPPNTGDDDTEPLLQTLVRMWDADAHTAGWHGPARLATVYENPAGPAGYTTADIISGRDPEPGLPALLVDTLVRLRATDPADSTLGVVNTRFHGLIATCTAPGAFTRTCTCTPTAHTTSTGTRLRVTLYTDPRARRITIVRDTGIPALHDTDTAPAPYTAGPDLIKIGAMLCEAANLFQQAWGRRP